MVKALKKAFSSFVAMMTIVSSVGFGSLGFANVATAATLMAGDLVKASGPAVYYYGADGKRYVFPNEKTYFSWYADFSSVKTITDAELAALSIGGNVTYKPGVKMVKITTDPKVYAVDKGGTLRWVESEAVATALYGSDWNKMIDDVPDAFFVNYTVGSSIPAATSYDKAAVMAAATSIDVDKSLAPSVAGQLTVSLASDTPAGITVTRNASSQKLAKYTFWGGTSDVTITGLTVHRVGSGLATELSNVYLYDANGVRLTTGRTINSTAHTAAFSSLSIVVPANGSTSIYVYGDFNVAAGSTGGVHAFEIADAASVVVSGSATVGGNFPVKGNSFTVGTGVSGRLDVTKGTIPGNPNVGAAEAEVSSFKLTANTNDIMVDQVTLYQAGSITNADLTDLKLYQGSTLVATAAGVTTSGRIVLKFTSPYLITNGTTKIFSLKAKVGGRANRTIVTYVEYTTDVTATDKVYGAGAAVCIADTAIGGCSATSQGSFDGDENGAGTSDDNSITVTTQGGTLTNAFNGPATSNIAKGQLGVPLYKFSLTAENTVEIRNLRFSVTTTNDSAAACLVKGSASTNYFRNIRVKNLDTGSNVMGPTELATALAASSDGSGTITLSDAFNVTAGQTLNLAVAADLSNSEDATGQFFGNSNCGYVVILQAFQSNDVRIVDTGEFLALAQIVPNQQVTGNAQNVKASSLSISLAGSPSSGTVVKKSANVPIAGLVLSAGAQSSVKVTSITLTCQAKLAATGVAFGSTAAKADCNERITSLSLWNGATQVGQAKAPDTTTGAAQISNTDLTVAAGQSVNLTVAATFSSTASTTSPFDQVSVGIAADADVQAQDMDSNTVTASRSTAVDDQSDSATPSVVQTIRNSGVVTYNTDSHPVSTIVIAGKDVWVPFASYKATAQFEAMEIDRIAMTHVSSSAGVTHNADNAAFTAVAIASGGAVKGSDILSSGSTSTKDIDLTTNKIIIPKDGSVNFQLWAKLSAVQSSSTVSGATTGTHRSGQSPRLGLRNGLTTGEWDSNYFQSANIRSTGQASGERIYASSTNVTDGNVFVTRKSKPIVTKQSISSTTLSNSAGLELLKFQVAADTAGTVALKQIMLSFSKSSSTAGSGALSVGNFRVYKGSQSMALADFAVSFVSSTGANVQDVEASTLGVNQNTGTIIVSFTSEETISGSGNVYSLKADISGAASGSNVSLSFLRDTSNTVVTGYLNNAPIGVAQTTSTDIYNISTAVGGTASGNPANASGTFVWSDLSELPHSTASGTLGGSRDWTNDVYVEDISQTQTLSL
ncbi:hypothetical protein HY479_00655 [Candidatus Uhrbacteria bacterium]|nr:hypothetical protein [Candidatus Uhrbacteria bacterium]